MFPRLERTLGKSMACRDIHRRILSHVPPAYRPVVRMVSATFNAATEVSGGDVAASPTFREQVDAIKALIAANDVPCLRFCEKTFKWDLAGPVPAFSSDAMWERGHMLKHAFETGASVETVLYVRQQDLTARRGDFEGFICDFNRKDVLDSFSSSDYRGLSKKMFIRCAAWDCHLWILDFWLAKLGRKSKRLMETWNVLAEMETDYVETNRSVLHWAIVNKIPFPKDLATSGLISALCFIGSTNKSSRFYLFVSFIDYLRAAGGVKVMLKKDHGGSCFSVWKDNTNANYVDHCMAYLAPHECECGDAAIHKGRRLY